MLQIGEMKMSKAAKFDEFLSSNNINCFSKEEIDNEMHSIVYRAHMEVSSQNLPTMIVLDDSIYTMIQVRVAAGVVNAGNRRRRFDAYQPSLIKNTRFLNTMKATTGISALTAASLRLTKALKRLLSTQ